MIKDGEQKNTELRKAHQGGQNEPMVGRLTTGWQLVTPSCTESAW